MNQQRSKPGPHKQLWARKTWIHKESGYEMTIETDHPKKCKELFMLSIIDPGEWREKR